MPLPRPGAGSKFKMAATQVVAAIREAGSLDYSRQVAERYAQAAEDALDGLDDGPGVAARRSLARSSRDRGH